uniref:Uncharacterized protein n=1 Tax=Arundo donax TaxID=35708 RepID=A0A0A9BIC5_ARUDO
MHMQNIYIYTVSAAVFQTNFTHQSPAGRK